MRARERQILPRDGLEVEQLVLECFSASGRFLDRSGHIDDMYGSRILKRVDAQKARQFHLDSKFFPRFALRALLHGFPYLHKSSWKRPSSVTGLYSAAKQPDFPLVNGKGSCHDFRINVVDGSACWTDLTLSLLLGHDLHNRSRAAV